MEVKGDIQYWEKFRRYLILNNIGLVKFHQDSINLALKYFSEAFELQKNLIKNDTNTVFEMRIAYSQLLLAKVYLKMNDCKKAEIYFSLASLYLDTAKKKLEFNDYYLVSGELAFQKGNCMEAVKTFLTALEIFQNKQSITNQITAHKRLSECYFKLNDLFNYKYHIEAAYHLESSRKKELDNSRIIQIKAENDIYKFNQEIERAVTLTYRMIIAVILLLCLLSVIAILYIRTRRANKILVRKSVELMKAEKSKSMLEVGHAKINEVCEDDTIHFISSIDSNINDDLNIIEADEEERKDFYLQELAHSIDNIIIKERLYLKQDFSILDLSEKLKVNRTYISIAVNKYLKEENFKSYINTLRVKEVIKLLDDDHNDIYTLEALFERAGFNSRNSFNRAFLKHTGVTPSYYQKNRHQFEQAF